MMVCRKGRKGRHVYRDVYPITEAMDGASLIALLTLLKTVK